MVELRPLGRSGTLVGNRLRFCVLATLSFSTFAANADGRTWHIRPDSTGDAPTIQAAMDSSQAGDDVLLAPGTFSQKGSGFSMLHMKPGVWLHTEAGREVTILDAHEGVRVIRLAESGTQTRIEGVTIIHGFPLNDGLEEGGGGIYITGVGQPTIVDCDFTACSAFAYGDGGAIECTPEVQPTIRGCRFQGNLALREGGAIACNVAIIEDCEFTSNQSRPYNGGAISCGAAQIRRCTFRNNVAGGDPGGGGGAISSISATIESSSFDNNTAGGFLYGGGGAIADGGTPRISDCRFVGNSAFRSYGGSGGAISMGAGTVARCFFASNSSVHGGAVWTTAGSITSCIFLQNTATSVPAGGGSASGGAIWGEEVASLENCILIGNTCTDPAGVGAIAMTAAGTVTRCIVESTGGPVCAVGSSAAWSCCDLFGNPSGNTICGAEAGGNFSLDPQFCAVDAPASLYFALQGDSPCAPGNHPDGAACGLIGAAPVGCGTVSAQKTNWSRFKSLYR